MQRNASSASNVSWQASIQFQTQLGTAWRRHIAEIAAYIPVASPSEHSRHQGVKTAAVKSSQDSSCSEMVPCTGSVAL
jgi:hypothetical protein